MVHGASVKFHKAKKPAWNVISVLMVHLFRTLSILLRTCAACSLNPKAVGDTIMTSLEDWLMDDLEVGTGETRV